MGALFFFLPRNQVRAESQRQAQSFNPDSSEHESGPYRRCVEQRNRSQNEKPSREQHQKADSFHSSTVPCSEWKSFAIRDAGKGITTDAETDARWSGHPSEGSIGCSTDPSQQHSAKCARSAP